MATRARLFVPQEKLGPLVVLDGAEHHYLVHVLRLRPGAQVTLLDGQGSQADALVTEVAEHVITLSASPVVHASCDPVQLWLLCGLLKGDKQDFVIQKATELGVHHIVPVKCQYSVVQVSDDKADAKRRRWLEIARHAAQQCRRPDVPTVSVPLSLADALSQAEGQKLLLFEGSAPPLGQVLDSRTNADRPRAVSMLIGPEGGLHKDEVALATEQGFSVVSLGPRILRAETAVVATLAVVSHHLHLQGASLDPSK